MTVDEAKAELDKVLTRLVGPLAVHQRETLTKTGKLWQGRALTPRGTSADTPAVCNTKDRPVGQLEDWSAFEPKLPPTLPGSCCVDVYLTPAQQWGYTITVSVRDGDLLWSRALSFGPEAAHRTHAWRSVDLAVLRNL